MATDPTLDRVRELMGKHGMLPDPVLAKFVTVLPKAGWRELTPKEAAARSDSLVPLLSRSIGKTSLFNDALQAAADRIATLEAENATLRAQLAGKVSISCADATAAIRNAPTLVPTTAMPSTALAHRKPQIGLRTL